MCVLIHEKAFHIYSLRMQQSTFTKTSAAVNRTTKKKKKVKSKQLSMQKGSNVLKNPAMHKHIAHSTVQ